MRTIAVAFGREVNDETYKGYKTGKARGVWNLHPEEWDNLRADVLAIMRRFGPVLFHGVGKGLNTVTGESGEEGYTVVIDYSNGPHMREEPSEGRNKSFWHGIQELQEELTELLPKYGQLEYAFTDGVSETVGR